MTFTVRAANEDDIPALAGIHVKGWQAAYENAADAGYLQSLDVREREEQWQDWLPKPDIITMLAQDENGHAAGFVSFGKLRTPPPGSSPIRPLYAGEIYSLYILPDYWRRGLGRQLMREAAQGLEAIKIPSLCLWVLEKNKRAVSFYEKMSGQRCGKQMIEIGPNHMKEICFGWRDIKPLLTL